MLEDDGFVPIGRITLVGGRFLVHFDRLEARSWGPVIYAFRVGAKSCAIGKTESHLANRMRQWEGHVSDALHGIFHKGGTNPWEAFEWRRRLTEFSGGEFLARRGPTDEERALIRRYNPPLCNDSRWGRSRPPEARGVRDVTAAAAYWRRLNNP